MDDQAEQMSAEERRRKTAEELMRRRVLAAYNGTSRYAIKTGNGANVGRARIISGHRVVEGEVIENVHADDGLAQAGHVVGGNSVGGGANATSSYKKVPINQQVSKEDWQRYHSAWQNYYQKYYSEYYAKAARRYIETEKLKYEREKGDDENLLGSAMTEENIDKAGAWASRTMEQVEAESDEGKRRKRKEKDGLTLRERIRRKATDQARETRRHHKLVPVIAGVVAVLLILFLQFNRVIFAPIMAYVSPGNVSGDAITAIDPMVTLKVSNEPKLMIPKLNVDVPVHFGISNDDATVMAAMNEGVAQFAINGADAMPGQNGNLVITGHSAGDIYSNNQYKFIFSGLERLVEGDKIYVNYEGKQYTYAVTRMKTIEPTDIAALQETTGKPQLILVTCTPLGTSRYRLLVYADQVNPPVGEDADQSSGSSGTSGGTKSGNGSASSLPANEPSFFDGVWNFLTGQ